MSATLEQKDQEISDLRRQLNDWQDTAFAIARRIGYTESKAKEIFGENYGREKVSEGIGRMFDQLKARVKELEEELNKFTNPAHKPDRVLSGIWCSKCNSNDHTEESCINQPVVAPPVWRNHEHRS